MHFLLEFVGIGQSGLKIHEPVATIVRLATRSKELNSRHKQHTHDR